MARFHILLVVALWGATPGASQLLRGYPSYMASSSWSSTFSNGKIVEHSEFSRSATASNGRVVEHKESKVTCKDGRCSQSVSVSGPSSVALLTRDGPFEGLPRVGFVQSRLFEMLGRFHPWRSIEPVPEMPRAFPVEQRRPTAILFLAPRSQQPQNNAAPPNKVVPMDWPIFIASLSGASLALVTLIAAAFLRCRLAESRELPLRSLGEPLAPANQETISALGGPGVATCPATEKASEDKEALAAAVDGYLQQMYMRAIEGVDKVATQRYLSRVYKKACA